MGEHPTKGISLRGYAKRRNVAVSGLHKRVKDGTLRPAMLLDGSIDPEVADHLLAEGTTAGTRVSSDLSAARRRKAAAAVALLLDEVEALAGAVVTAEVGRRNVGAIMHHAAARMWRIAEVAPAAAGRKPAEAADMVHEAVYQALGELSGTKMKAEEERNDAARGPVLSSLNAVQLAALRANLQAKQLEITRGLARGELVRIEDIGRTVMGAFMRAKSHLLALHYKTAPILAQSKPADAAKVLDAELYHAIYELGCEWVSPQELIGNRSKTRPAVRRAQPIEGSSAHGQTP